MKHWNLNGSGSLRFVFLQAILLCSVSLMLRQSSSATINESVSENDTDRLALLKFKESISDDPKGVLSSWNDSFHFCKWRGILCTSRRQGRQRVVVLDLPNQELQGTISPYIGNLSFLRFISLTKNRFSGDIPAQIGRLTWLQHLNLFENMLEGEIPVNLSHCLYLRLFALGKNRLVGKIPLELDSLVKLRALYLQSNNLTGRIPAFLGNMSSLQELDLLGNNLVGTIPDELGRLKSLTIFSIGTNYLSGTIPHSLYNFSSLVSFSITDNQFKGTIPSSVGLKFPNLQEFFIGSNEFSGEIPESISNASWLQQIDLSRNTFEGQVPASFGLLRDLQTLALSNNRLGSYSAKGLGFISTLTNYSRLAVLDLSANKFMGVLPNSIANFSTGMMRIYLGENKISGSIPAALENLANLISLSMEFNLFTGEIPASLCNLRNLQVLVLHSNTLSGKIPTSIGNLNNIFALLLSCNKLEGSIPLSIADCQGLQELDISNNALSGGIPKEVFSLYSSISLNFSWNSFSGAIPSEVGNLKHLHTLDLSENLMTGEIPETIGDCESMEFLYFQRNLFQGTLPTNLASLRGLQYLDVSRNNLTGKISKDLEKLHFLLFFNLSFNNLDGEVPENGVFRNTSAVSLAGNSRLCGGVSRLELPRCPIEESKHGKAHGLKLMIVAVCLVALLLVFAGFLIISYRRRSQRNSSSAGSTKKFFSEVSFNKLYRATGGFSQNMLIGTGGFGSVYKGFLDQEENPVAVKVFNLQKKGAKKSFMAECNALRNARHRNLVKILTCCSSMDYKGNEFKALVFEYMSNGSLEKWLHDAVNVGENRSKGLNVLNRLNIAIDVASALYYLHEDCDQPIAHCDLKPSNVLLDNEMTAHVSDFGVARLISKSESFSEDQTSTIEIHGTIGYAAPEYSVGSEPSEKGDVYSYGILALEMFTGRRPTEEIFKDDFNLHKFVKMALPERLVQIVDSSLLPGAGDETASRREDGRNYAYYEGYVIDVEEGNIIHSENANQIASHLHKCLVSVLEIGLACSEESPNKRMGIGDVTRELPRIRDTYMTAELRRQRQRGR